MFKKERQENKDVLKGAVVDKMAHEMSDIRAEVAKINNVLFGRKEVRSLGFGILLPARPGLEDKLEAVIRHLGIVDFTKTPAQEAKWVAQPQKKHGTKPGNKTSGR